MHNRFYSGNIRPAGFYSIPVPAGVIASITLADNEGATFGDAITALRRKLNEWSASQGLVVVNNKLIFDGNVSATIETKRHCFFAYCAKCFKAATVDTAELIAHIQRTPELCRDVTRQLLDEINQWSGGCAPDEESARMNFVSHLTKIANPPLVDSLSKLSKKTSYILVKLLLLVCYPDDKFQAMVGRVLAGLAVSDKHDLAYLQSQVVINGLLGASYNVNCAASELKESALHVAARWGDVELVHELIRRGADVDQFCEGRVPLHAAIDGGSEAVLRLLCDSKARINDVRCKPSVHEYAQSSGSLKISALLLRIQDKKNQQWIDAGSPNSFGDVNVDQVFSTHGFGFNRK